MAGKSVSMGKSEKMRRALSEPDTMSIRRQPGSTSTKARYSTGAIKGEGRQDLKDSVDGDAINPKLAPVLFKRGAIKGKHGAKNFLTHGAAPGRPLHPSLMNYTARTMRDVRRSERGPVIENITCYERARDGLLAFMSRPFWNYLSALHLFLVIGDGAFFFFLLCGWHAMCGSPEKTDCEPRNWWFNASVQLLNLLFTYGAVISMPWRVANAEHLSSQRRPNHPGVDFYGLPSEAIWFHIPTTHRKWIISIMLANNVSQFANQATRCIYYSYELADTFPGNLLTNLFFFLAMLCALVGALYQWRQESILRGAKPGRFPDPIKQLFLQCRQWYADVADPTKKEEKVQRTMRCDGVRDERASANAWALEVSVSHCTSGCTPPESGKLAPRTAGATKTVNFAVKCEAV